MMLSEQTTIFLRERLNKAGIKTAVVVDDAFDPPTLSSVQDEVFEFWNNIERHDNLREQLKSFDISTASEDDITDDTIAILWSRREEPTSLINLANSTLFAAKQSDLEDVERIVGSLEGLGLKVDRVGTDCSTSCPTTGLVFIDYYLGNQSDPTSTELSTRRAREIYYASGEDEEKPFIILMSSYPDISSQSDGFRNDSGLLGGLFDFISKVDLNDPTQFTFRVASWASSMPLRHKIQNFMETLESTLRDRTQEFMKKAKSLTIEDYAFVQTLSLEDDGHPLGDYIQWLLSSLLVNKVLEANDQFTDSRNEINKMSVDFPTFIQLFPSTHLAEIYSVAIAEQGLGEIERHSSTGLSEKISDTNQSSTNEDSSLCENNTSQNELPMLRLGDLLVNTDGRRVHMIITPDCDLQFTSGNKRIPIESQSVLLLPGQLRPLSERISPYQIQTELYFHDSKQYRITWERKKIVTVPVARFFDWCADEGYCRPARIRLPYAVKIQQEVIAKFSRIGMPVSPPLQDFFSVEVYCEGANRNWEQLGPALDPGVVVIYTVKGGPKFVLTAAALNNLLGKLYTLMDRYEIALQEQLGATKSQRIKQKIKKLDNCIKNPEIFVSMLEVKRTLPKSKKSCPLVDETIGLYWEGDFSDRFDGNFIVGLNIVNNS